jgi:hypothetical protein
MKKYMTEAHLSALLFACSRGIDAIEDDLFMEQADEDDSRFRQIELARAALRILINPQDNTRKK